MSQYITDLKKCIDCGEWLPFSAFQKTGNNRHGKPSRRAHCKKCDAIRRKHNTEGKSSPCWTCEDLTECKALLWTFKPLPCYADIIIVEKKCPLCGTVFVVKHKNRVYCSNYCRHKAAKIRQGATEHATR